MEPLESFGSLDQIASWFGVGLKLIAIHDGRCLRENQMRENEEDNISEISCS